MSAARVGERAHTGKRRGVARLGTGYGHRMCHGVVAGIDFTPSNTRVA